MRTRLAAAFAIALAFTAAPSALAAPAADGVFPLTGTPGQIAIGAEGEAWVVLSGSADGNLARIDPDGTVTYFAPAALVNPVGITYDPADGNLWLTRNGGVVRVPPDDPDSAQDFNIADISDPRGITSGPDGRLWTGSGDKLIAFEPANPLGFEATTIAGMSARGIAAGPGEVFVADFGSARLLRTTPPGPAGFVALGGGPQEVAAGPNGQVAVANPGAFPQEVALVASDGSVRAAAVAGTDPFGVAFAPDGRYWFANFASHDITRLDARSATVETFTELPPDSGPRHLALAPAGAIWVALETAGAVARITGVTPKTRLTRAPKRTVGTRRARARVRFAFRSTPGASFRCALKGRGLGGRPRTCASPLQYRLKPGRYRFSVRAFAGGAAEPRPARRSFRVKRRR